MAVIVAVAVPIVLRLFSPVKPVEPVRPTFVARAVVAIATCDWTAIATAKLRATSGVSNTAWTRADELWGSEGNEIVSEGVLEIGAWTWAICEQDDNATASNRL